MIVSSIIGLLTICFYLFVIGAVIFLIAKRVREKDKEDFGGRKD